MSLTRLDGHLKEWGRISVPKGVHMAKGSRYPAEFRSEAVRLYKTSGRPQREIAHELGISHETLRRWVVQTDIDAGDRAGLSTQEREELRRLRRENRVLRDERDILKKAAAFFAKEQSPHP